MDYIFGTKDNNSRLWVLVNSRVTKSNINQSNIPKKVDFASLTKQKNEQVHGHTCSNIRDRAQ